MLISIVWTFISNILDIYGTFDSVSNVYVIRIAPGNTEKVVIASIYTPISFILDKNDDLIIKYISIIDITSIIPANTMPPVTLSF